MYIKIGTNGVMKKTGSYSGRMLNYNMTAKA